MIAVRAAVNCSGLETHYEDVTTNLQNGFLLVYSVLVFVIGMSYLKLIKPECLIFNNKMGMWLKLVGGCSKTAKITVKMFHCVLFQGSWETWWFCLVPFPT